MLEIRKSYRKRALELHPDLNLSATAKDEFILLNEAYEVLKNSLSRARYNKLYNYDILHETPRNEDRFQRRNNSRRKSTTRRADKGKREGEKYSTQDNLKFKKCQRQHVVWDILAIFVDFLLSTLSIFG